MVFSCDECGDIFETEEQLLEHKMYYIIEDELTDE